MVYLDDGVENVFVLFLECGHHALIGVGVHHVAGDIIVSVQYVVVHRIIRNCRIGRWEQNGGSSEDEIEQIFAGNVWTFAVAYLRIHVHLDGGGGREFIRQVVLERIIHDVDVVVPRIGFFGID